MFIISDDENEEFKISTYPNVKSARYMVSNYGSIYDIKKHKLKKVYCKEGYIRCELAVNVVARKKFKKFFIHRLVAWEFINGFDLSTNRIFINHKDGFKDHNFYKNLEWCTPKENSDHAHVHLNLKYGTPPVLKGTDNPNNKYSEEYVMNIITLVRKDYSNSRIMMELGFDRIKDDMGVYNLIRDLKRKKVWKYLLEEGSTTIESYYHIESN